jgi:hypothetical protein
MRSVGPDSVVTDRLRACERTTAIRQILTKNKYLDANYLQIRLWGMLAYFGF